MANITSTEASGFIPEIWLQTALGRLRAYLTIQKTVTKNTDLKTGSMFSVGDVLHLPKRGVLTVNDKAANTNYTPQTPQSTTVDLTLSKHKEVTFIVESRALASVNQDVIAGYVEDSVIAIAEQIDSDLFGLYASIASFNGGSNLVTAGATLTDDDVLAARKILVDNKVPANTPRYGIIGTSQSGALLKYDPFVRFDSLGVAGNIANGTIGNGVRTMEASLGKIYGFEIAESQLVPFSSTTKNLFYSPDAILFASRPLENPDASLGVRATVIADPDSGIAMRLLHSYQHLLGGHAITLDVLYGYALMRSEHACVVTTTT